MSKKFMKRKTNMTVSMGDMNFHINKENSIQVQRGKFPPTIKNINLNVTGEGVAFFSVSTHYVLKKSTNSSAPTFKLNATPRFENDKKIVKVQVCTNFLPSQTVTGSNMVVVEANLPSGYHFGNETEIYQQIKKELKFNKIKV